MLIYLVQVLAAWGAIAGLSGLAFGHQGVFVGAFEQLPVLKLTVFFVLLVHVTIVCMSLSFHRAHTHQAVVIHPWVDRVFQTWLWLTTSMTKRDWVSVHSFHHAHADRREDPHSPVQKGLWRIILGGAFDYTRAKSSPEVQKIRPRIPEDRYEAFLHKNNFLGLILSGSFLVIGFGPGWGSLMMVLTFLTSPMFAVGGVNGLAHAIGYRNHQTDDNSRNLGFLIPLNWMACGELDHNNHHAKPSSASFRHRWWEFDVGYVYLVALSWIGLARIKYTERVAR